MAQSKSDSFKCSTFDGTTEDWLYWHERLKIALRNENIKNQDKKRNILLGLLGPQSFKIVFDSVQPTPLSNICYNDAIGILDKYFIRPCASQAAAKRMAFLHMVSRDEWRALPSTGDMEGVKHPVENVIYNYSLDVPVCLTDDECVARVQEMQKADMEKGKPDINFNFLIGGNGKVYEGRGWYNQTDGDLMFPEYNGNRIDIAYIGNYITDIPEEEMIVASDRLMTFAVDVDLVKPRFLERQIVLNKKEDEKEEDKETSK